MNFMEYAKLYKPKINDAIEKLYNRKLSGIKNEFLKSYYSELKDYFLSGGKRIRPLLSIATYHAFIKDKDDRILSPSVGVEFLHNASLIHDDIIDNDNFRRGNPSFHFRYQQYHEHYRVKKMKAENFGHSIGIIGGDTAFFMGMEAYLYNRFDKTINMEALQLYEEAFIEIADGVLIETDMVHQENLTMDDYIHMVSLKTGALLEKSILIGAVYANTTKEQKKLLSKYGMNLGIIFQIIDDILGTFGDEKVTGKPSDSDIKEGKKTCLLIETLNRLDPEDKNRLNNIMQKTKINDEEVKIVKEYFIQTKAEQNCRDLAEKYYHEAKEALNRLDFSINSEELEFFDSLLEFVAKRQF